jgi:hypothetical protein
MLNLKFKDSSECAEYLFGDYRDETLIYKSMYESIREGFDTDSDKIIFAKVEFDEEPSIEMKLNRVDWIHNLNACLNYFEDDENYEMCSDIKKLMADMG